jgi:membrane associated rhomboid family serine protease
MLPLSDDAPVRRFPIVTTLLIAANVLVFLWLQQHLDARVLHYGYYPCSVEDSCVAPTPPNHLAFWAAAFTSMFMHASWAHLGGNMLFLGIFGNNVEDVLGRFRYLAWYLAAGLAATATQTYMTLHEGGSQAASIPNLGASGAIAGVLGAYLLILPFAGVRTFPFVIFRIPAVFVIGLWFLGQLYAANYSLVHPEDNGGIAFFAHIGGFVFGALTIRLLMVRPPAPRRRRRRFERVARL